MADRNLSELIRFLDPSGDMSDADVAEITRKLKFTDVLDLVGAVGKGDDQAGRDILSRYDSRFTVAKEYGSVPGAPAGQQQTSGFKKIAPQGTVGSLPTTGGAPGQQPPTAAPQNGAHAPGQQDLDQIITDPQTKNSPEVKQIQSLLQRLQQR